MKKEYMKPEMEVYEIKTGDQLLAGSDPIIHGTTDNEDDLLAPELDMGLPSYFFE